MQAEVDFKLQSARTQSFPELGGSPKDSQSFPELGGGPKDSHVTAASGTSEAKDSQGQGQATSPSDALHVGPTGSSAGGSNWASMANSAKTRAPAVTNVAPKVAETPGKKVVVKPAEKKAEEESKERRPQPSPKSANATARKGDGKGQGGKKGGDDVDLAGMANLTTPKGGAAGKAVVPQKAKEEFDLSKEFAKDEAKLK